MRGKKVAPEVEAAIIRQYATGRFTQALLASAFHLSIPTVNKILRAAAPRYSKHGMSSSPEYDMWVKLRRKPNVCARWKASFSDFILDVGPRATPEWVLRRKNPMRPYERSNCQWVKRPRAVPQKPRTAIRARQLPKHLTFRGRTMSIAAWARETGLGFTRLRGRLRTGWGTEEALTTPPNQPRQTRAEG
jgi:hypothetical protein